MAEEKQQADISVPAVLPPEGEQEGLPARGTEGEPEAEQETEPPDSIKDAFDKPLDEREPLPVSELQLEPDTSRDSNTIITVQPDGRKRPVQRATREEPEAYDRLLDEILSEEKPKPLDIPQRRMHLLLRQGRPQEHL